VSSPSSLSDLGSKLLRRFGWLFLAAAAVSVVGCGHPASRDECEIILEKTSELQLKDQNITEPAVIAERVQAFKDARGDELMKLCVGRTMTKSALDCVKHAATADDVDRCLM